MNYIQKNYETIQQQEGFNKDDLLGLYSDNSLYNLAYRQAVQVKRVNHAALSVDTMEEILQESITNCLEKLGEDDILTWKDFYNCIGRAIYKYTLSYSNKIEALSLDGEERERYLEGLHTDRDYTFKTMLEKNEEKELLQSLKEKGLSKGELKAVKTFLKTDKMEELGRRRSRIRSKLEKSL